MEFDETPRFWGPRVALIRRSTLPSVSTKTCGPIFVDLRKKRREEKLKINPLTDALFLPKKWPPVFFYFFLSLFIYLFIIIIIILIIILLFDIHSSYCFIRVPFCLEKIYLFSVHFILNELNPSHFLTSEIFVKISSLKSLTTYHPENRKIFRLSQNSTKLF